MQIDDIIYLICLLSCIGLGGYYKKIKDDTERKMIGTGVGLLIIFVVSGFHALHCVISFFICALVITNVHASKCHLISFGVMFGYLAFFRTTWLFGIPPVPGHTNMIQMILTLKMAGVAFEKNAAYNKVIQRNNKMSEHRITENNKPEKSDKNEKNIEITEYDIELQDITIAELFHYGFNYIGVLTGPYYRYRTYRDYFETSFKHYSKSSEVTLEKLKYTALYCFLYLVSSCIWPVNYTLNDEFYEKRSWLYRLWYVWPAFFIFRMRIYTGLTLSECVCTNAGFGAYPTEAEVANGEGPKGHYLHLKRDADKHEYNFKTIQNIDVYNTETCWTFREAMKHWNICVQYWLAVNIYKRFPNKKYRTAVTLLISAFWHGFHPGHYFCIMGAPFYVPVEDMYNKLVRKNAFGLKRNIIDCLFWISKFFGFSYMGMAFMLLSMENIWHYYSSVYHFGYVYYIIMLLIGLYLIQMKRESREKITNAQNLDKNLIDNEKLKTF